MLRVGSEAFGVYDETGSTKGFVYLPDAGNTSSRETIFSVDDAETLSMSVTETSGKVDIQLTVQEKGKAAVTLNSTVMKRI